ncbi:MAG: hypothetical protein QN229_05370 [Desulfurococcaceae archaeon TW002]
MKLMNLKNYVSLSKLRSSESISRLRENRITRQINILEKNVRT